MLRPLSIALALLAAPASAASLEVDYCVGAGAAAPSATRETEALEHAAEAAFAELRQSVDVLNEAASLLRSAPTKPRRALLRGLFRVSVQHWLAVEDQLCACLAERGAAAASCAKLPEERARACALLPRRLHGIDVPCLTKGR